MYRQYNTLLIHSLETLQTTNIRVPQYSSGQRFRLARLELQCRPVKQSTIPNASGPYHVHSSFPEKKNGPFCEIN